MSTLLPLVRERFKSKSQRYTEVAIKYDGDNLYRIVGIKNDGHCEWNESISESLSLKVAREAMWVYAEVQDGLLVKRSV